MKGQYIAPDMEIFTIACEQGFATSDGDSFGGGSDGEMEEGGEV